MDRFFSLCALYPADHVRILEVASEFKEDVEETLGLSAILHIEPARDGLSLRCLRISRSVRGHEASFSSRIPISPLSKG